MYEADRTVQNMKKGQYERPYIQLVMEITAVLQPIITQSPKKSVRPCSHKMMVVKPAFIIFCEKFC
jgi:hypothetical protein